MDIGTVMTTIQGYEQALSITSPYVLATKRAYLYIPDRADATPDIDPVGFFNGYTLDYEHRSAGGLRQQKYTVQIQMLVRDPSLDKASQIASAFLTALITALDAHVQLGGACTVQTLRGASPTLTRLEWAGVAYIGLHLLLDVLMDDVTTVGV